MCRSNRDASGTSQARNSTPASSTVAINRTDRLNRSNLATSNVAPARRAWASAFSSTGRALLRPDSTSTYSRITVKCPLSQNAATVARCASIPSPFAPWLRSVETRRYETIFDGIFTCYSTLNVPSRRCNRQGRRILVWLSPKGAANRVGPGAGLRLPGAAAKLEPCPFPGWAPTERARAISRAITTDFNGLRWTSPTFDGLGVSRRQQHEKPVATLTSRHDGLFC